MALDEKYPLALPEGTILAGQYVIEKALGQGGFGITYKARDHKTGQSVAVKEFFPDALASRTAQTTVTAFPGERGDSFVYGKVCFLQEAETLAEFIGNENIVRVFSYFEENGTAYFVMEFIEGMSFEHYIKEQGGKVSYEEAEKILLPVIDALATVHAKGIVHRDVTPDNIYITKDGTIKLLDFGAARYSLGDKSRSLDVVLKHGFAPKEQYTRRGRQGAFTDVYTVGASFYFAITGRRPPDSIDRMDEDELIPPGRLGVKIPPEKEDAILKAMSVQPSNRYQTMVDFREALMRAPEERIQDVGARPIQQTTPVQGIQSAIQQTTPVQGIQSAIQQTTPVQGIQRPIQQTTPVQGIQSAGQQQQKKEGKKKPWILPMGIGAGITAAVAIMIAVAFSGGNAKEDSGDRTPGRTVEITQSGTKPEQSGTKPEQSGTKPENKISFPQTITYENCSYECYSDGTAVLKTGYNATGAERIPATVEYQSQTFRVTSIDTLAFYYCSSLTSIELPDGVTSIGDSAFDGCSSLTSIKLPDSVTNIGRTAFEDCSSLTGIELPNGVTSIGNSVFWNCSSLTSIKLSDGVTSIGDYAFYNCSSLTGLELPDGVTSIGDGAFSGCSSLTGLELPDGLTSIGSYVFSGCSSLTGLELPDSVTVIGSGVFFDCGSPTHTENIFDENWSYECYSNGMAVLSTGFNATGAVSIPATVKNKSQTFRVTSIGCNAFYNCSSLTSIEIPDSVTSLRSGAFLGCSSLTNVEIPDSVMSIGANAFDGCSSLTSIEIPDSVTSIGDGAFQDCSSLTSIEIPDSVTEIGILVFNGCSSLKTVIYGGRQMSPDEFLGLWE